jgi:lipopolysaccharide biosynthesis glycosyltransferase
MKQEPIEIFFAVTGNYAPFVATTAFSIIGNTNEAVNFHVLTENFEDEDKRVLTEFIVGALRATPLHCNVTMDFTDVSEQLKIFEGAQLVWFKSYIPYARLLIPDIFLNIDKAIYMDVDIIVNCDIKELWNIDFYNKDMEYALAAAKGYKDNYASENFGISPEHKYFNNGLLLLNCRKWREEMIVEKLLEIAAKSKLKFRYPTQDLFNIYFDNNNYVPFDEIYNYQPLYTKHIEESHAKLIHYTREKPWENENCPQSEAFWKIAGKTPYYEFFIEKLQKNRITKRNFAAELRSKKKNDINANKG